ncbi:Rieske (2Fe-2S) protein [Auraticoccus monumenti]|uniref:Cytochrome bc1 complex Rieske iron-sulfur subunit n=1 Tax=Auraticoccus monumenti TaxID=675864 RepID=A0A1G7DK86_9ACTN|nr:Rieske (2Fe-2S) protein [Auraticoccus monumenti]SDE51506.1 Rieske Fe-S protein [Auraticoccus monumenti]
MTQPRTTTSRRALLRGGGIAAVALGGGLTACAAEQPTAGSPSDPAGSAAATPGPSAGSTSPSASAAPSATASPSAAAPTGGVQVAAAQVPVGGGTILEDADYVVTQPEAGQFKAFSKICTHQGCPVSDVAESEIVCFCHGSAFSISDGSVLRGPADQPLAETPVTASGDQLSIG